MKFFNRQDMLRYPRFANYVKHQFTDLWQRADIRKAFKKYGQMSTWELKRALSWGGLPYIVIENRPKGKYGRYLEGHDDIRIATRVVEYFEAQDTKAFARTADGRRVYFAGAVLLHEMVHWGDFRKDGMTHVEQLNVGRKHRLSIVDFEAGKLFEEAVYGQRLTPPHD